MPVQVHAESSPRPADLRLTGVGTSYFADSPSLPLVVSSRSTGVDLAAWAAGRRAAIRERLDIHGAVLFRGFSVANAGDVERVITAVSGAPLAYMERSSPRSRVAGNIYTSTDYDARQEIFVHNEQSYNLQFPLRVYFGCLRAADSGGETPIVDCRRVFRRLRDETRALFADGYLYVRNFGAGPGMSWQEAFQTDDRHVVEAYGRRHEIDVEWRGESLRTRQRRRAIARHPRTGEQVWFNHLTFFHLTTLPPVVQAFLLEEYPHDLPNQTYHVDRRAIAPAILDELRAAYRVETVMFRWQAGDVLALDNMLVAHGRRPFAGSRTVVVGMAETCAWADV